VLVVRLRIGYVVLCVEKTSSVFLVDWDCVVSEARMSCVFPE